MNKTKEYFKEHPKEISKKLRTFRTLMNLSLEDVGNEMMLSKQQIWNIENNGCKVYYYLIAFSAVYNIDILAFFDEEVYISELEKIIRRN